MADPRFQWPINVPEPTGRAVARDIGFVEGEDFVNEGRIFWFDGIEKAIQFNRALADEPHSGRASPDDARIDPHERREHAAPMGSTVTDNAAASRFELTEDGATAFADYHVRDGRLVFTHTEVPDRLSGRGVGSRLAEGALGLARARGLPVVAQCPFIAAYVRKHPEHQDLLATS